MFGKYRDPYRGPRGRVMERSGSEIVAILLAAGISTALNVLVLAAVWLAVMHNVVNPNGIGENTTQVLTGWGGGMLGVLGAYVGYTFGKARDEGGILPPDVPDIEEEPPPAPKAPKPPKPPKPPEPPRAPDRVPDTPGTRAGTVLTAAPDHKGR